MAKANTLRIFMEGPDNSGKTTIGKLLAERLGYKLRGRIVRQGPDKVLKAHLDDIKDINTIYDRTYFISDMVYEPVYAKEKSVLSPLKRTLSKHLAASGVTIFIRAEAATLRERYEREGDDIQSLDNILKATLGYNLFFKSYKGPLITVPTDIWPPEVCVDYIMECLEVMHDENIGDNTK